MVQNSDIKIGLLFKDPMAPKELGLMWDGAHEVRQEDILAVLEGSIPLEPLPISEPLLKQLGFNKSDVNWVCPECSKFVIRQIGNQFNVFQRIPIHQCIDMDTWTFLGVFKYVHEIQDAIYLFNKGHL